MPLIPSAYAQTAAGADAGGLFGGSGVAMLLPYAAIFVVFYFLMIRPQQQQQKALKARIAAVRRGDRVLTAGGIVGTVQKSREGSPEIEVEIAPNVRVTVMRETLSSVLTPTAANDAKSGDGKPSDSRAADTKP